MAENASGVTTTPATWAPDPWQQHQLRFWDGTRWTEHVANGGLAATDRVPAGPPPAVSKPGVGVAPAGRYWAPAAPARLSFAAAVARCFRNYANFKGRAGRSEFWWFALFYVVTVVGFMALDLSITDSVTFSAVVWLALVLPYLAVLARRLHDTTKSGWSILVQIVPIVGPIMLIVWLASKGHPVPNEWGPPPA